MWVYTFFKQKNWYINILLKYDYLCCFSSLMPLNNFGSTFIYTHIELSFLKNGFLQFTLWITINYLLTVLLINIKIITVFLPLQTL